MFPRYVGLCATIKLVALAIFAVDWWLVRRRKQLEYTAPLSATGGVGSIISLDKCKFFYGKKERKNSERLLDFDRPIDLAQQRLSFDTISRFQYSWKRVLLITRLLHLPTTQYSMKVRSMCPRTISTIKKC